jgi:hypothetical protein
LTDGCVEVRLQNQPGIEIVGLHTVEQSLLVIHERHVNSLELHSRRSHRGASLIEDAEPGVRVEKTAEDSADQDGHDDRQDECIENER